MPSQRYLLVEGVDEHLVSDPRVPPSHGDHARYVGWELLPEPAPDPDHVAEHYRKAPQVVLDHTDLRKAIASGRLTLLRDCIAKSHDSAREEMI